MQIGNQYAYRALFEELESEKVILRYKGMLKKRSLFRLMMFLLQQM